MTNHHRTRIYGSGRQEQLIEMPIPVVLTMEHRGPSLLAWKENLTIARIRLIAGLSAAIVVIIAVITTSLFAWYSGGTLPLNTEDKVLNIVGCAVVCTLAWFAYRFGRALSQLQFFTRECLVDFDNHILIERAYGRSVQNASERRIPIEECSLHLCRVSLVNDTWCGYCLMFLSTDMQFVLACDSEARVRDAVAALDKRLLQMVQTSDKVICGRAYVRR